MTIYQITAKGDSAAAVKYTYTADAPLEFHDYPFALFDHTPIPDPPPPPPPSKYGGRRQLTHEEFRELFTQEEQWDIDAFEVGFEARTDLALDVKNRIRSGLKSYYAAEDILLDNPKVEMLLGVFAGLQLIAIERIQEVLNG